MRQPRRRARWRERQATKRAHLECVGARVAIDDGEGALRLVRRGRGKQVDRNRWTDHERAEWRLLAAGVHLRLRLKVGHGAVRKPEVALVIPWGGIPTTRHILLEKHAIERVRLLFRA